MEGVFSVHSSLLHCIWPVFAMQPAQPSSPRKCPVRGLVTPEVSSPGPQSSLLFRCSRSLLSAVHARCYPLLLLRRKFETVNEIKLLLDYPPNLSCIFSEKFHMLIKSSIYAGPYCIWPVFAMKKSCRWVFRSMNFPSKPFGPGGSERPRARVFILTIDRQKGDIFCLLSDPF
jgi:hypothetical protein